MWLLIRSEDNMETTGSVVVEKQVMSCITGTFLHVLRDLSYARW